MPEPISIDTRRFFLFVLIMLSAASRAVAVAIVGGAGIADRVVVGEWWVGCGQPPARVSAEG